MLRDAAFAIWFLLPAGIANVTPIFSARIPGINRWRTPLDGGRTWHGQPLLGANKTWRGLITGLVAATLVFWLQKSAVMRYDWAHTLTVGVDYGRLPTLLLGPLLGLGALGGDAVESFFKRRRHVTSGQAWVPFDQLDYIIGGVLVTLPFVILSASRYAWIFVIWFGAHIVSSYIGYLIGLKEHPI